jgi:chorismate dehydratase
MALPLRIGLFPYLNVQPLIHGLRGETDFDIVIDLPSRIADRFHNGELDLAMVPSFEAPGLGAPVLDSVCIAGAGAVETVLLHHRVPLARVQTLALDTASRTSAALAKILIAEAAGRLPETRVFSPLTKETPDADAILVIGDPAFTWTRPGYEALDLGGEWFVRTGLPFVFALMSAGERARGREMSKRLLRAIRVGQEAAPIIASSYNSGVDSARAEHYITKVIRYDLGPREKEGLALFYRQARTHALRTAQKELEFHAL